MIIKNPIELMNHSCDPNCGVLVRRAAEVIEIHALRDIAAGEELGYDYATFEDAPEFLEGPCLCGSPICRGRLTGYAGLPADRRAALAGYIAPHLLGAPVGSPATPMPIELGETTVGEPVGSPVG